MEYDFPSINPTSLHKLSVFGQNNTKFLQKLLKNVKNGVSQVKKRKLCIKAEKKGVSLQYNVYKLRFSNQKKGFLYVNKTQSFFYVKEEDANCCSVLK